jgi:hypothetical protein
LYHRVPLLGCVQVGEYDLEEMNSWLIFDRVALALSMMVGWGRWPFCISRRLSNM